MHPGPMNRGVEIASRRRRRPASVILEQVTNGVAVRMAVLYLLGGRTTVSRLLIKHGRVVDPTPAPAMTGLNVLIVDGKIAAARRAYR